MLQLPPVPTWDGLHPLIIHFPIGLLLIAPVFVLIGAAVCPKQARSFLIAALLLMLIGTASTFIAVETGEAAGKIATRTPEINRILERHEALAERTRVTFTVLTTVFAVLLVLPIVLKRNTRIFTTALPLLFLLFYGYGAVLLANTAHNGGRLVHEYGVQALVAPTPGEEVNVGK
ncbi:MAG TPA: DUF2231 domain-containing protein [Terriglobales bacterium]|nr:DUF2231 domain-containing protein [Terriglobales bacterium]